MTARTFWMKQTSMSYGKLRRLFKNIRRRRTGSAVRDMDQHMLTRRLQSTGPCIEKAMKEM
jgi:hypothetical protein